MPANYHSSNRSFPTAPLIDRHPRKNIQHGALSASTVATVTLDNDYQIVEVENRGTTDIFFTVDGTTPTVNGTNCYVVAATAGDQVRRVSPVPSNDGVPVVVKLISSGTPNYTVMGTSY